MDIVVSPNDNTTLQLTVRFMKCPRAASVPLGRARTTFVHAKASCRHSQTHKRQRVHK